MIGYLLKMGQTEELKEKQCERDGCTIMRQKWFSKTQEKKNDRLIE